MIPYPMASDKRQTTGITGIAGTTINAGGLLMVCFRATITDNAQLTQLITSLTPPGGGSTNYGVLGVQTGAGTRSMSMTLIVPAQCTWIQSKLPSNATITVDERTDSWL